jgi:ABC-type transport system involved in multi-copper enzyme maturation permease subunit
MKVNESLNKISSTSWNSGFSNLFKVEIAKWLKSRAFITHLVIWCSVTNGFITLVWIQSSTPEPDLLITLFSILAGMMTSTGIIIIMQDSIVGEIKSGTSSWILSKPITRESYILAKWTANTIGAFLTMTIAPSLLFFIQIFIFKGVMLDLSAFGLVVGVLALNVIFYLSFTLMMGTFQLNNKLVIGVPIAFYISQQFIIGLAFIGDILPWGLTAPLNTAPSIIVAFMTNTQPFSLLPILATSIYILVFLVLSVRFIAKQEI